MSMSSFPKFPISLFQFTVAVLNATLDLAALVLVGVAPFLGLVFVEDDCFCLLKLVEVFICIYHSGTYKPVHTWKLALLRKYMLISPGAIID